VYPLAGLADREVLEDREDPENWVESSGWELYEPTTW